MLQPVVDILLAMHLDLEFTFPPVGMSAQTKYGDGFPPQAKQAIDASDCALFGTTDRRRGGGGVACVTYMRWGKKLSTNLRPIKCFDGMPSPLKNAKGVDFVIVRELLEGLYPGREGTSLADLSSLKNLKVRFSDVHPLNTSLEGTYAVRVITKENTRKIFEAACRVARRRQARGYPGKVTTAQKSMMLPRTDGLWRDIGREVVNNCPGLAFQSIEIDTFAYELVRNPQQFDVVVLANEHGDVLSDEAAGLLSGLWTTASAYVGKDWAYFEPTCGGEAGTEGLGENVVNPTGALLAAVYMLEYLGMDAASRQLEAAVSKVYAQGDCLTRDLGGRAFTTEFCERVKTNLFGGKP